MDTTYPENYPRREADGYWLNPPKSRREGGRPLFTLGFNHACIHLKTPWREGERYLVLVLVQTYTGRKVFCNHV